MRFRAVACDLGLLPNSAFEKHNIVERNGLLSLLGAACELESAAQACPGAAKALEGAIRPRL